MQLLTAVSALDSRTALQDWAATLGTPPLLSSPFLMEGGSSRPPCAQELKCDLSGQLCQVKGLLRSVSEFNALLSLSHLRPLFSIIKLIG